ncbi:MAG TPA: hypothetical protein VHO02_06850, partial [Fibrobacteria bacterium]|nr:hypothetical protein [Fibrobacteria bacterium]
MTPPTPSRPPDEKAIVDLLRSAAESNGGAVGWPRLMRELAANPEQERGLKKLLKKMAAGGRILKLKGKRYAMPDAQV